MDLIPLETCKMCWTRSMEISSKSNFRELRRGWCMNFLVHQPTISTNPCSVLELCKAKRTDFIREVISLILLGIWWWWDLVIMTPLIQALTQGNLLKTKLNKGCPLQDLMEGKLDPLIAQLTLNNKILVLITTLTQWAFPKHLRNSKLNSFTKTWIQTVISKRSNRQNYFTLKATLRGKEEITKVQ